MLDEPDAIEALLSGDIAALRWIVERYELPALRLAYSLCNNRQLAEDAVAESFLAVVRYIASYDPSRPFQAWFYRIVVNSVRAARRRERRLRVVPDARDVLVPYPDPSPGPEAQVIQREAERALLRHVDQLPDKQREAVVLRYFLDMDERAMSTVLGVPTGTVKWRLHQARKKLRGALEDGSRLQSRLIGEVQEP